MTRSTCLVKIPSTSSITLSSQTTLPWRSETNQSTTPSAACTEPPTWWTTPSSAKGKHQFGPWDGCNSSCGWFVHSNPMTCSVFTKPSAFSRVATVYVNNGSLGTFRSQLSMNVFTVSGSPQVSILHWMEHVWLQWWRLKVTRCISKAYYRYWLQMTYSLTVKQMCMFCRIQSSSMRKMLLTSLILLRLALRFLLELRQRV